MSQNVRMGLLFGLNCLLALTVFASDSAAQQYACGACYSGFVYGATRHSNSDWEGMSLEHPGTNITHASANLGTCFVGGDVHWCCIPE